MKFGEMPEEVREKVQKLRKCLCEVPVEHLGVREEVCMACVSPCGPGREMLRLLGLPQPQEPARMADVFEPVTHARGRKAERIVHAMNRRRPK